MPESVPEDGHAISRRQALVRGIAVGGAAWTAPAVSVVAMTSAHAAQPSPIPGPPHKPPVFEPPKMPPPEERPPTDKPRADKPPVGTPPAKTLSAAKPRANKPPTDQPVAESELPKTGTDGVATSVALGVGAVAAGAALLGVSRQHKRPADNAADNV